MSDVEKAQYWTPEACRKYFDSLGDHISNELRFCMMVKINPDLDFSESDFRECLAELTKDEIRILLS